jgi:cation diffusion facilitator family transporter
MSASGSKRAIVAAFFANLGIAIAKVIGFLFTGAASMLAEAIHSFADTANQGLLILGSRLAEREATLDHPFGYGRERYFWSFIVAMVLFSLGAVFAIYEGVSKLLHPHELTSPQWAIGILVVAIALEAASFRVAIRESNRARGKLSWWDFIRHSKIPELPVVLLEDLGALVGLVFALSGVGLALVTGDARWDAAGSIAIGVLLAVIATILAREMRSLLLGEAAHPHVRTEIVAIIERAETTRRVIHMRTQHLGPEELLVGVKVEFDARLSVEALAGAIDDLESRLRADVPIARVIYIEPDIHRDDGDS